MVICNSIGHFTVVLSASLLLVLREGDLLHVWILSAVPSLPPCYLIRTQACLFLFLSFFLLQSQENQ
jgi:hypothetical protein